MPLKHLSNSLQLHSLRFLTTGLLVLLTIYGLGAGYWNYQAEKQRFQERIVQIETTLHTSFSVPLAQSDSQTIVSVARYLTEDPQLLSIDVHDAQGHHFIALYRDETGKLEETSSPLAQNYSNSSFRRTSIDFQDQPAGVVQWEYSRQDLIKSLRTVVITHILLALGLFIIGFLLLSHFLQSQQDLQQLKLHEWERAQTELQDQLVTSSEQEQMQLEKWEKAVLENNRLQTDLRTSDARFRAIFTDTPIGFALLDRQGKVIETNHVLEEMLLFTAEEFRNMRFLDFTHPEDRKISMDHFHQLVTGQTDWYQLEKRYRRKDGQIMWVKLMVAPVSVPGERPSSYFVMVEDITKLKEVQEELVKAKEKAEGMNRLKTNFLANMSHELRTPMNSIIGFASILCESLHDEKEHSYAQRILGSSQQLLHTLNDLLDLAKLEANKQELDLVILDVVESCRHSVSLLESMATRQNLSLNVYTERSHVYSRLDSKYFGQIINNLVGNAIKFTPEGEVRVEIKQEELEGKLWAMIRVIDTGIGIDAKFLPFVFDEFQQESRGYARNFEGSGLGLTITKRWVEIMGGEISVTSEKGLGSTFEVRFAAVTDNIPDDPIDEKATPQTVRHLSTPTQPLLLLVEDDFNSQEIAQVYLAPVCELETASRASEALAKATAKHYDVVIMDINLGFGPDGMTTVKKLREIPGYAEIPIIAMTAYAMKGDQERFLGAGFDDYISKPYTKEVIIDTVLKTIQHRDNIETNRSSIATNKPEEYLQVFDDALKKLMPKFLNTTRENSGKILEAVEDKNFDTVKLLGHRMKGNGKSYGFAKISEIGQTLEEAAISENVDVIHQQVTDLQSYLDQVQNTLD